MSIVEIGSLATLGWQDVFILAEDVVALRVLALQPFAAVIIRLALKSLWKTNLDRLKKFSHNCSGANLLGVMSTDNIVAGGHEAIRILRTWVIFILPLFVHGPSLGNAGVEKASVVVNRACSTMQSFFDDV